MSGRDAAGSGTWDLPARAAAREVVMTSDVTSSRSPLREAMREGARELSGYSGWFLVLGVVWTLFGMYVLSYRVGSLAAVAALVRS